MTEEKYTMLEAAAPREHVRRAYNLFSFFYGAIIAPMEHGPRMKALERAGIRPGDRVLEVAVGPGATLVEILKRVDRTNIVHGVDLSPMMLKKARRRAKAEGYTNIDLREADAIRLPFPDSTFDVLYNSYMLDLIPFDDMPVILGEFRRVLRPGGRLVLVNMSKRDAGRRTLLERIYTLLPRVLVPYFLGSCRPVLMEGAVRVQGFRDVRREFVRNIISSEIITATRP